jgi:hypothetical protein
MEIPVFGWFLKLVNEDAPSSDSVKTYMGNTIMLYSCTFLETTR